MLPINFVPCQFLWWMPLLTLSPLIYFHCQWYHNSMIWCSTKSSQKDKGLNGDSKERNVSFYNCIFKTEGLNTLVADGAQTGFQHSFFLLVLDLVSLQSCPLHWQQRRSARAFLSLSSKCLMDSWISTLSVCRCQTLMWCTPTHCNPSVLFKPIHHCLCIKCWHGSMWWSIRMW